MVPYITRDMAALHIIDLYPRLDGTVYGCKRNLHVNPHFVVWCVHTPTKYHRVQNIVYAPIRDGISAHMRSDNVIDFWALPKDRWYRIVSFLPPCQFNPIKIFASQSVSVCPTIRLSMHGWIMHRHAFVSVHASPFRPVVVVAPVRRSELNPRHAVSIFRHFSMHHH
jgi:hypothetical protein